MQESSKNIYFHFLQPFSHFKNRTALKSFLIQLIEGEGFSLKEINYIFCSDEFLLNYNKEYLHHDTLTDIITFPLHLPNEPILADVYISLDRVRENAKSFGTSFIKELHRVIFHGALHLCGFKDKTQKEQLSMRQREAFYLHKYFVSRETF